ncbi:uncharacterized protein EI90DRAFT_3072830 [Cantharellus anzutake]|uniref:uncharacterized protein n=1 Tax=Cantharellus anzutake TaxID=1750568 RepID=UPI0019075FCC|nr:uncharacterized protein EI90DRAFT_3072830 [Cantharellus anzutake]KAF8325429.1 hypothetical protein EI90DRAFT_3072830 [Cantharellus anzutake]
MASFPPTPGAHALPPLPPGWTEHRAPTGQLYYYHAATNHSTYVRPLPLPGASQQSIQSNKEKPLLKIPIPNTPWLRVKTTHGNVFFTHTEKKESVWVVPDEIKDAISSMDWPQLEEEALQEKEKKAQEKEVARVAAEIESDKLKRKAQESELPSVVDDSDKPKGKKRKAEPISDTPQAIQEISIAPVSGPQPDDDDEEGEEDQSEVFSNPEEEEKWQREMAEDMAELAAEEAEAGTTSADDKKHPKGNEDEKEDEKNPKFTVPNQVNLSPEEAKTLFKTLLTDKNPSPLAPFASVMPLLITDPRYVLLPSQADRESAFNEWCREASRAARLAKASTKLHTSALLDAEEVDSSTGVLASIESPKLSKAEEKKQAQEGYDALLKTEVTSTRMTWEDFKRNWKKDRRFFAFGRDDREREKVFRAYLKELGEKKRAQAKKAELDFMELLKEHKSTIPITPNSDWKEVKKTRSLIKDLRYDAVGSSSLREELFGTFLKALSSNAPPIDAATPQPASTPPQTKTDRKARAARALQERTEQARVERDRAERSIAKNKAALGTAEAEQELMSLYVDSIRDPKVSYREFESTFANHPRFASSPLAIAQKQQLFAQHAAHLNTKYQTALDALFLQHAPSLSTIFDDLPPSSTESLDASLPAQKLGIHFDVWMRRRTGQARRDFDALLHENSFVEFWGKVKKLRADGEDIKTLAKSISENEMDRVLKNDQRYRAFDHLPEERMRWVKVC